MNLSFSADHDHPATTGSRGYDKAVVDRIWNFAQRIPGNDIELWRKDEFGAWLYKLDYGNRESQFGWEICDFGMGRRSAGIAALRPLQWQNYLDQFAGRRESRIAADGLRNTRRLF
ncbi:MAG: hypothetical protein ACC661_11750 [Verrucomicrobiales bacterium]